MIGTSTQLLQENDRYLAERRMKMKVVKKIYKWVCPNCWAILTNTNRKLLESLRDEHLGKCKLGLESWEHKQEEIGTKEVYI